MSRNCLAGEAWSYDCSRYCLRYRLQTWETSLPLMVKDIILGAIVWEDHLQLHYHHLLLLPSACRRHCTAPWLPKCRGGRTRSLRRLESGTCPCSDSLWAYAANGCRWDGAVSCFELGSWKTNIPGGFPCLISRFALKAYFAADWAHVMPIATSSKQSNTSAVEYFWQWNTSW